MNDILILLQLPHKKVPQIFYSIKDIFILYYISFFIFALQKIEMFSKTLEYAIRAMIFIAQKSKAVIRVGIKEIAKAIDAPLNILSQKFCRT